MTEQSLEKLVENAKDILVQGTDSILQLDNYDYVSNYTMDNVTYKLYVHNQKSGFIALVPLNQDVWHTTCNAISRS